jgi:predicted metalloprotease with PDZ domain
VLSHEFFHLWNVKRTRAKVLGPFDYLTLPKTGALWWLEGVTDYYANLLPYRYEEWDRQMFLDAISRNLSAVKANPARLEVSPYDASFRVSEAANGRGNSNGYRISYYNLGWLCGLCLDIEIRSQTNNKRSLDDVTRALYDLCKNNQPGFEEDEIRKQCIRFGGESLGAFYDKVVMTPGELPVADQLAKMGLKLDEHDETFVDTGFTATSAFDGHGARVTAVSGPGQGQLQPGDIITTIEGLPIASTPVLIARQLKQVADEAQPGTRITLDVTRGDQSMHVVVNPATATRKVRTVVADPAATAAAVALREEWLKTKLPAVQ